MLSRSALASFAFLACLAAPACGGSRANVSAGRPPVGGGRSDAGLPSPGEYKSDVPMATMPTAFRFTSKRAERKALAGSAACVAAIGGGHAGDLGGEVARLGKACEPSTQLRPYAGPFTGSQTQAEPAHAHKFRAQAGKCYRVYAALAPTVKNVEILVVDGEGIHAWEARSDSPRAAAPEDGALCFTQADDAQVLVSVGAGEGAYAVQVWSD